MEIFELFIFQHLRDALRDFHFFKMPVIFKTQKKKSRFFQNTFNMACVKIHKIVC